MARTIAGLSEGTRVTDYISLGVVAKTFPLDQVRAILRETGRESIRQSKLPAHVVFYYVIALALFSQVSYGEVLRCLVEGLGWLGDASLARVRRTGRSAISMARANDSARRTVRIGAMHSSVAMWASVGTSAKIPFPVWRIVVVFVGIGLGLFVVVGLSLFVLFALLILFALVTLFVFVLGRLPIGIRPPLLDADEERGPVVGPRGPAKLDHAHRLREVAVSARIESEALVPVLVEIPPRQRDVGGVLVCLVLERFEDREVGGLVPPSESPVRCGVRVERAELPAARIEDGDGVADLPVRVDGEREQVTLVLPRECRDVSEAHQRAGRHRPHDDVDAVALFVLGLVAPDYEIRSVIGEGERLDVFDLLLFAGQQVHQTQ
ncbi:MAG: transposase domain-containing protein [Gemmatimonadetes bacterium]|nr:transposase domain-containing protein [Gemmatimonadota bacterium]